MEDKTVSTLFTVILQHFLKRFPAEVTELIPSLVNGVISVYGLIKKNLLPTPKKSHYTFNLRDISKVFQGICSASAKYCQTKDVFFKLWTH
jgi:dynein heavy chain